jgi:hypothetical protein
MSIDGGEKIVNLSAVKLKREIERQVQEESADLHTEMPPVDDIAEVLGMLDLLGPEVSNKLIKKGEPEFRRRRNTQLIAEHYKK